MVQKNPYAHTLPLSVFKNKLLEVRTYATYLSNTTSTIKCNATQTTMCYMMEYIKNIVSLTRVCAVKAPATPVLPCTTISTIRRLIPIHPRFSDTHTQAQDALAAAENAAIASVQVPAGVCLYVIQCSNCFEDRLMRVCVFVNTKIATASVQCLQPHAHKINTHTRVCTICILARKNA